MLIHRPMTIFFILFFKNETYVLKSLVYLLHTKNRRPLYRSSKTSDLVTSVPHTRRLMNHGSIPGRGARNLFFS
jgi:hypothetical protein